MRKKEERKEGRKEGRKDNGSEIIQNARESRIKFEEFSLNGSGTSLKYEDINKKKRQTILRRCIVYAARQSIHAELEAPKYDNTFLSNTHLYFI